jgi:hypothetical protein
MKKYLFIVIASSLLIACGGEDPIEDTLVDEVVTDRLTPERSEKAKLVFQTVPSPLETASIFQNAGSVYNTEITNPIDNVNNYVTKTQQALNLGVYGADLSYANIFDQSQESMFYMNCSKKMADGLGITTVFDDATMERIEDNMNERDSLMLIINDVFWLIDAYLKENEQSNLSALIITGGWIEGLYLGVKSLDSENPSEELMKKVADQKYSLDNLVELLRTYDNEEINKLALSMEDLKAVYDKIEVEEKETTISNDGDVPTIGGGNTLKYETSTIFEIAEVIEKIRNEIIQ